MKKTINFILSAMLAFIFLYLMGAFYATSFNVSEWPEGCRFFVVTIMTLITPMLAIGNYNNWEA